MSVRNYLKAAISVPILLLGLTGLASADLNPNQADIRENINVPAMAVVVNSGGSGCVGHQVWEPTEGGCSDSSYQKTTAHVVSVTSTKSSLNTGTGSATSTAVLTALVKTENGKTAPAGLAVTWTATSGTLSSYSGYTDANGQVTVTLSAPKGTAAGTATFTASAVAGGASTNVSMVNTARVVALSASPATVKADNATTSTLTATLAYADGTAVGASENVSWGATIGALSAGAAATNASSQAIITIKSATVGTSTITASAAAGAMSTTVAFTTPVAPAPSVTSFDAWCGNTPGTSHASAPDKGYYCIHDDEYLQFPDYQVAMSDFFTWTATGATRYELWDVDSTDQRTGSGYGPAVLICSTTGTTCYADGKPLPGNSGQLMLKAFNGPDSTSPVTIIVKKFPTVEVGLPTPTT